MLTRRGLRGEIDARLVTLIARLRSRMPVGLVSNAFDSLTVSALESLGVPTSG